MVRVVLFREQVQHLVIDQLVENVDLLVEFQQVLVETGPFGRHLVVGFLQFLLQFIIAFIIERLKIGTFAVCQVVIISQFFIG